MHVELIAASYLLGSIPVAWLVTRLVTGQDLRRLGTGNVGVMNVAVSVARWAGVLVFLAEAAKGVVAVSLARAWIGGELASGLAVLAAVAGTGRALLRAQGRRFDAGGAWWKRAVRFLVGVSGVTVIWLGLRQVLPRGEDMLSQTLRYFRYAPTGFWIIYLAPLVFLKLRLAQPVSGS